MKKFLEVPVIQDGVDFIKRELPKRYPKLAEKHEGVLPYHNLSHALDVLSEAILFAEKDSVFSDSELLLLAIAAIYHDTGFAQGPEKHEESSAEIVGEYMKKHGFSEGDIKRAQNAILAGPNAELRETEHLGKYLIDADTSNLGREDFFDLSECVFQEDLAIGRVSEDTLETRQERYRKLYDWMSTKKWETPAAQELRTAQLKENIKQLKEKI